MSKILAANEIKKFLNSLKSLNDILEQDGVSEQAVVEAKKELEKLKADKGSLLAESSKIAEEILKLQEDKKVAESNLVAMKEELQKQFDAEYADLKAKSVELEKVFANDFAALKESKEAMLKDLESLAKEISLKQKAHQEVVDKIESLKRGL